MTIRLARTLILSASTLALLAGPTLLPNLPILSATAAIAGNGNGNGGDNGNGGGNGGGGGGGGDHGNSGDNGNSGGNGSGSDNGNSRASRSESASASGTDEGGKSQSRGKKSATEAVATLEGETPRERTRNLKAELGGLNSLKRNINGLMNSSDPRMDGIRAFIVASANLEAATAMLEDVNKALDAAEDAYLKALTTAQIAPGVTPQDITNRITVLTGLIDNATPEDDIDALNEELEILQNAIGPVTEAYADLTKAQDDAVEAQKAVDKLADATDVGALEDALGSAANRNRDVTGDVVAWASEQLGVGDADGLIDDYIAGQN